MRVIAGELRGRPLQAPPGAGTRPMTDRVKQSLFDVLGVRFGLPGSLPAVDVLDLFAGSGALGIECLSRGARSCLFVENNRRALKTLRANIGATGLAERCKVATDSVWTLRIPPIDDGYGLVFVDPPYRDATDTLRAVDLLDGLGPRVAQGGVVLFRCAMQTELPTGELRRLRCEQVRRFGTMKLYVLAPV